MTFLANEYVPLKPLIAIIGEELNQTLTAYLKHQFVPQLNVISCLDASEFASCLAFSTAKTIDVGKVPSQQRKGILRADWLEKHQSHCPAVALVLVPRHHATGDPSSWATLASSLDAIRALTNPAKIRVVVAIVQPPGDTSPLPDDRTAMLARHSGADRGCVVLCEGLSGSSSGSHNAAAMRSLGVLLQAQAAVFYSTNAQTRLNSYSQNGLASVDANLRAAFKLGALAEMRGDWPGAVQLYKEAYGYVGQVSMAGGAPLQRFLELRTVAELVHHRLLALLLGALRDPAAATQLNAHLDMLRAVPLSNASASLLSNHAGWVAKQYNTAAELVTSCGLPPSSFPPSMRPAQLFLEAYHAASTRRRIGQELSDKDGGGGSFVGLSNKEESVKSGRYLGQIEINSNANPSDEQVETWLEMEEIEESLETMSGSKGDNKYSCVDLLKSAKNSAAIEASRSSSSSFKRSLASIDTLLGEELLYYSGDTTAATQVLSTAAEQYRKDRWSGPLYRVLMALRECAGRENIIAEHVTLSLEAAATVVSSSSSSRSSTGVDIDVVGMAQDAIEDLISTKRNSNAEFILESETTPWAKIVTISAAGFGKRRSGSTTSKSNSINGDIYNVFEVKLQNAAPVDIPFLSARVLFEDSHGIFEVDLETKLGTTSDSSSSTTTTTGNVLPGTTSSSTSSSSRKYKEDTSIDLVCTLPSGRKSSPWIAASKLKLHLSHNFSITYLLPAAMAPMPTAVLGETAGPPSLRIELPARHTAPSLALLVPEKGFIGEYLPAKVKIMTKPTHGSLKGTGADVAVLKKCRVVVSAAVAEKAAAVLFTKGNSNSGGQLKEQLEFDVEEDLPWTQNDNNSNIIDIDFGFSVQAPVEETINFSAQLHYTIEYSSEEKEKEGAGEQGVVDVNAALPVLLPFECDVALAPMAVPTIATSSISGSTGTASTSIMAGPVYTLYSSHIPTTSCNTSSAGVVEDVVTASLRSLSIQDAQLRRYIAPRLPPHFTLPAGAGSKAQWCAAVSVRKVKPTGGEWRIDVDDDDDEAVEALNIKKLSIESRAGGRAFLDIAPLSIDTEEMVDSTMLSELHTPGDTCCAAFQITTQQNNEANNADGSLPSPGNLIVTWQRSSYIPLVPHYCSSFTGDQVVYNATLEGLQDGRLVIPLPSVSLTSPLITAQPFYPSSATAGEAITLEVEIKFPGKNELGSQEVEVAVGDPHGFLIAGPRATTRVPSGGGGGGGGGVDPSGWDSSRISLCLVPYHVGYLELPEIKVSVYGQKELQATQGCIVFVKPAVVGGGAVASA